MSSGFLALFVPLKPVLTFCTRCGDDLEFQDQLEIENSVIKLNIKEMSFVRSRFRGPLCVACVNQLKTSYKILHGDFTDLQHEPII